MRTLPRRPVLAFLPANVTVAPRTATARLPERVVARKVNRLQPSTATRGDADKLILRPARRAAPLAGRGPPVAVPLKLKQHDPSTSSGTLSASAWALVVVPCWCDDANAYAPTSSSTLDREGPPTSAAFTRIVSVHGEPADGVRGQLSEPLSALPPVDPGSGYVSTCGSHADTEQRSTLCVLPA